MRMTGRNVFLHSFVFFAAPEHHWTPVSQFFIFLFFYFFDWTEWTAPNNAINYIWIPCNACTRRKHETRYYCCEVSAGEWMMRYGRIGFSRITNRNLSSAECVCVDAGRCREHSQSNGSRYGMQWVPFHARISMCEFHSDGERIRSWNERKPCDGARAISFRGMDEKVQEKRKLCACAIGMKSFRFQQASSQTLAVQTWRAVAYFERKYGECVRVTASSMWCVDAIWIYWQL